MTRHHRRAHVWLWFFVGACIGCAFVVYVIAQLRGEP
jgi:hypothetical protein